LMGIDWAPETIFYAFVNLPEGRMSTRKGRVVHLDDLIDEALDRAYTEVSKRRTDLSEAKKREIAETIGISAVRYNIVRVQAEKAITFHWEEALNFEGNSSPFVQYAHARACSILSKSNGSGRADRRLLVHPQEQRLLRRIAKFPSGLRDAAIGRRVHSVAGEASEFAAQFNQFYRHCPVLTAEVHREDEQDDDPDDGGHDRVRLPPGLPHVHRLSGPVLRRDPGIRFRLVGDVHLDRLVPLTVQSHGEDELHGFAGGDRVVRSPRAVLVEPVRLARDDGRHAPADGPDLGRHTLRGLPAQFVRDVRGDRHEVALRRFRRSDLQRAGLDPEVRVE